MSLAQQLEVECMHPAEQLISVGAVLQEVLSLNSGLHVSLAECSSEHSPGRRC